MSWIAVGVGGVMLVGGAAGGSIMGSQGAKKQMAQMKQAIEYQKQRDAMTDKNFQPYLNFGNEQLNTFGNFLKDPSQDPMSQMDPGFAFRRDQGMEALTSNAATAGMLQSGDTLRGVEDYAQGLASSEYGNAFDRWLNKGNFLRGNAQIGSDAANSIAGFGNQGAAQVGNLTANTDWGGVERAWGDTFGAIGGLGAGIATKGIGAKKVPTSSPVPQNSNIFAKPRTSYNDFDTVG